MLPQVLHVTNLLVDYVVMQQHQASKHCTLLLKLIITWNTLYQVSINMRQNLMTLLVITLLCR